MPIDRRFKEVAFKKFLQEENGAQKTVNYGRPLHAGGQPPVEFHRVEKMCIIVSDKSFTICGTTD